METSSTLATVHFLKPDSFPITEKPYLLRLDSTTTRATGLETANYALDEVEIQIDDLRTLIPQIEFGKQGVAVLEASLPMKYEDFLDSPKIESVYLPAVTEAVRKALSADSVVVIPHAIDSATEMLDYGATLADGVTTALYKIRRRHPDFPISTGKRYEFEQPTNIAHVDVSIAELAKVVAATLGTDGPARRRLKRHQWVNVWRPLRGPVTDWPLALCLDMDAGPLPSTDTVDVVFPDRVRDIELVYHSSKDSWYYLPEQRTDECLLFLQGELLDGNNRSRKGIPHASFDNKRRHPDEPPRESIEMKLLVSYET